MGQLAHASTLARLIDSLRDGGTCDQIAERTGLHPATVRHYVRVMRSIERPLVYIESWAKDSYYRPVARYMLTLDPVRDKDVPRPPRMSEQERQARYKARRKAKKLGVWGQLLNTGT